MIVVVIIGILAAIAIPKFAATKEKAYLAAMKTDLRNLATAEEAYSSNSPGGVYLAQPSVTQLLPLGGTGGYTPSAGVTVVVTLQGAGWGATATHSSAPGRTCAMYVNRTAVAPATQEGVPTCT